MMGLYVLPESRGCIPLYRGFYNDGDMQINKINIKHQFMEHKADYGTNTI